jgi:hypothetical protein
MKTHFVWSVETSTGNCPHCNEHTVLVIAPSSWRIDSEDDPGEEDVEICEELTGHYCLKCCKLTSLHLNT